ncbi:hypothetical protein WALSEDRAFT_49127 [Wallemia mellicola CBS 633.66]|uniref:Sorting nexin-4 n=1 Tax=Wallemia mellicola (strain ATCC MYA-4683 / CBS 633.66) TaxID=671144 RepID=I4Y629_WALMC|nr:hypothetical protein WALSEDRAFT_49127 [Wallemia mellicola CBS 633.66]EIM19421.1 hypothetical protein WALSEDRAFT_49127 [Wallemia mellicola CBS 633.66]|eukprot:XP_006960571.1 hypothetical protein WALSEDRAFT_49127 [Wallemia mellicola CBS 633.66]
MTTITSQPSPTRASIQLDGQSNLECKIPRYSIELEGTSNQFVSYTIQFNSNSSLYKSSNQEIQRRFKDFKFLHTQLSNAFQASVIPPLPDQHRLEYLTGDRFSNEFIQRRRTDLERFLQRLSRHPILRKSKLLIEFFTSTEWNTVMHKYNFETQSALEPPHSILDNISDSLVNAFTKVKKVDDRFLALKDNLDRLDDSLTSIEKIVVKLRTKVSSVDNTAIDVDLTGDYEDQAGATQSLAYLESGITEPLNRFAHVQLQFSTLLRDLTVTAYEPVLDHIHSLRGYANSHKAVLKLRDQKQLDFEQLTTYLSQLSVQHQRLMSAQPVIAGGIGGYIRDRVDHFRGQDDERSRLEKLRKLEEQMKELEKAVENSSKQNVEFSQAVLREHSIFDMSKRIEMKEILHQLSEGHVKAYQKTSEEFERLIPHLQRIRVDV